MNTFSWKLGAWVSLKYFKSAAIVVVAMAMRLAAVFILLLVSTQYASADDKPKASTSAATQALPQLLIVDYIPISKTPVASSGRDNKLSDYVYRVSVRNSGGTLADVAGKVTSNRSKVIVTDADVNFGAVGSLLTVSSTDTFSVRADKNFDRRLDRKVKRNNRNSYEEDGEDDDDKAAPGLAKHDADWLMPRIDAWYLLKFSQIFNWNIQARQTTSAPVVSNMSPTGNIVTAQPTVNANYSDAAGIAVSGVILKVDGADVTSQATVTTSTVNYRPAIALTQGVHNVALAVANTAGKITNVNWSFTVDSLPPTILGELPKDTLNAASNSVISAQYSDAGTGLDLSKVQLLLDGQDVSVNSIKTVTGISYTPSALLSQGNHNVVLKLSDTAGNLAQSAWSFSVDTSAPLATSFTPANGVELPADALPAISASYSDTGVGIDATRIKLSVDGVDVTTVAQITATGVSYLPSIALKEGVHAIKLTVVDKNGNSADTNWSFTTKTPPVISLVSPKDVLIGANTAVTINAQYSDIGAGIDATKIRLLLDGVDVTSGATITEAALSLNLGAAIPQGLHLLQLTVTDKAGNSTATSWRFTIDTGLPVISNEQPKNALIATGLPVISANFQDSGDLANASGIDASKTKLWVNNVDVTAQAILNATSVPSLISYTPTTALVAGTQTVKLQVADKAGNLVESQWTFTVDTQGPTLAITSPVADAILAADALPVISATFSDTSTGIDTTSILVELDGQNITAQVAVTESGLSFTSAQALPEGSHTVRITVKDKTGNATVQTLNFKTSTAPVISAQTPKDTFLPGGAIPVISASFSDVGSGIETAQTKLFFNGTEVTAQASITATGISYTVPQALVDGTHTLKLMVADKAGNATASEWQFGTASPPEITATSPKDVLLPAGSRPVITASFRDPRSGINTASVRLIVNSDDVTSVSQVTATGISYTPAQALAAGPYTVYLEVANQTNAAVNAVWGFEVDTLKIYNLAITSPAGSQTVIVPKITVTASASANKTYPTRLTVGGVEMTSTGTAADGATNYSGTVDLIDGVNTLTVVATYADGETRSTSTQVSYDAPPKLTILSPADKAVLGPVNVATNTPGGATNLTGNVERPVTVTGRLSKAVTSVTINQQQAQLEQGGLAFSFANFFLREGVNMITAVATDAKGRISSSAITVNVDQTAPILRIESPENLSLTSAAKLDVRGMVNDAVEALHGAPEPTVSVTVNGKAVATLASQVSDRYFLIPEVPLQIGQNTLRITATDHLGNARSQDIQVSRIAVGSDRLTLLSGNHQTAAANTELAKPLAIVALNAAGEPLVGQAISFDVQRGSGSISTTQGAATKPNGLTPARNLTVTTDSAGRAQVWLTVGKQTGPGANVVQASTPKLLEQVTFTASTQRGAVFKINADLGTNQIAETNAQPLELLSAVVRDANDNLLPNVPVVFTIEEGDASFPDTTGVQATTNPNGTNPNKVAQRIILATDKNGLVALRPQIGTVEGTIRIKAQALKLETGNTTTASDLTGNATFLIQAREAKDGPASFSGFVYDDKSKPLSGIKLSIGRTNIITTTDASGKFELGNIPPGRIDLFVDGRTFNPTNDTTKPQYPSLHFEAYAVKGRDNQIAHPIYLPPLSTSPESVKTVGGNQDVTLTIPGLAGFQMKVKANSVTFPDGSRVGTLVVSPVTADKLPMAPPAGGAQFGVPAWTIQPAGTRFDPPIEVTLPNASSQPAGDNLPIVQWDHDLGQYVAMGRATVSEDGAVLVTDSGSGITKAGWGGACIYEPDKCATAKQPSISKLEIKVIGNGDSNAGGKVGEIWVGQNEPLAFISDDAAQNCSRDYTWNFGDGGNSKARNPFYSFSTSGEFNVTLKLKCKGDECVNETERSTNRVVNVCEKADATGASISFIQVPAGSRVKSKFITSKHFAVTGMEKVEIVDIGISCEDNYWFPYVKSIRGEAAIYQPTSLPQGVALINSANQSNSYDFCAQVSNLTQVPLNDSRYSGPYWSYQPAIDVHEMHHLNGLRSRFDAGYVREINSDWKIKFRELTSQISKQGAYTKFFEQAKTARAWETNFEQYSDSQGGNTEDSFGFGSAYRAEKPVSAPLAEAICKRAKLEGWIDIKSCGACR